MPRPDVGEMTTDELEAEFKDLARRLQPINARRKEIADELEARSADDREMTFLNLRYSKEQRRGIFRKLKQEFGEQ